MIIFLIFVIPNTSNASYLFGNATSDRVDCGSATRLDNINPITWVFWIYPTNLVADNVAYLYSKIPSYTEYKTIFLNDPGLPNGSILGDINRGGTFYTDAIVQKNGLLSNNQWQYVAITMNTSGSNSDQKIYYGTLTTPATEVSSYDVQTVGSGIVGSDASANAVIANNALDPVYAFPGRIAFFGIWNRALSAGEIKSQQFRPRVTSGNVLFLKLGSNGLTNVPDWSGGKITCSRTGATIAPHVPLRPLFGN